MLIAAQLLMPLVHTPTAFAQRDRVEFDSREVEAATITSKSTDKVASANLKLAEAINSSAAAQQEIAKSIDGLTNVLKQALAE